MKRFLAFGLAVSLISCGAEEPQSDTPAATPAQNPNAVLVSGQTDGSDNNDVIIWAPRNFVTGSSDTVAYTQHANGEFAMQFELEEPTYGYFICGDAGQYVYLSPGDTLNAVIQSGEISFSGTAVHINNYFQKKEKLAVNFGDTYGRGYDQVEAERIIAVFDSVEAAANELLISSMPNEDARSEAENTFIQQEQKNIQLELASWKIGYAQLRFVPDFEPNVPENYFAFLADFKSQIAGNDAKPGFVRAMNSYVFYLMFEAYRELPISDDGPDFMAFRQEVIRKNFEGENLQLMLCHGLFEMVSFEGITDAFTSSYESFKTEFPNSPYLAEIEVEKAKWDVLTEGNVAPDFTAYTQDGLEKKLTELKGQPVYIDVWATWCGPCRAEIPSLQEIEHEYAEKGITFLSVSIDDEKDEWNQMVTDEQLGGQQWFAEDAWSSEICKGYNIQGIPRFMLIDAEGNIVSANAPRPSEHDKLAELFDAQLNP